MDSKEIGTNYWKILENNDIFTIQDRITISVQRIKLPNGRIIDDYYQIKLPDAVVIVANTRENKIIMSKQYLHGLGRISYVFPAGTIEETIIQENTPLETARRELLEETGYYSREWKALGKFILHTNYGCGRVHFFFANDVEKVSEPMSEDLEEMDITLMTNQDIMRCIRNGEIISIGSIAAWTLTKTIIDNKIDNINY